MDLFQVFKQNCPDLPAGVRIEVGLSGGIDSVVLLHLLARLRQERHMMVSAVYVHHGLSQQADAWAEFCSRYCETLAVPLRCERVHIDKNGLGLEAAARAARYRVFSDGLSDIVALAHHQNDQVETFMLAVARGGGMRALAAMPAWRDLNPHTKIWRPLLTFSREMLARYAAEQNLAYVDDESNRDTGLLRNWLRHEALPQWQARIPHFERHILANIQAMQQDLALLDEVAEQDYQAVCSAGYFAVDKWRMLSEARRRRLLWQFVHHHQLAVPTHAAIDDFARVLMISGCGEWRLPDATIYAYRNRLFLCKQNALDEYPWQKQVITGRLKDILLDHGFILQPSPFGLSESVLMEEGCIRTVDGRDALKLEFGHKSAKKLLQESHILPLMRKKWPIITNRDNVCMAVVNLRAGQDFRAVQGMLPIYAPLQAYMTELNSVNNV